MDNTMNLNAELLRELQEAGGTAGRRNVRPLRRFRRSGRIPPPEQGRGDGEHPPSLPGREADKGREDESTDMGGDSR